MSYFLIAHEPVLKVLGFNYVSIIYTHKYIINIVITQKLKLKLSTSKTY